MSFCLTRKLSTSTCASPLGILSEHNANQDIHISAPFGIRHDVHIRYNFEEARFEGVPTDFQQILVANKTKHTDMMTNPSSIVAKGQNKYIQRVRAWTSPCIEDPQSICTTICALCQVDYSFNQHFNLHFRLVPRVTVEDYEERIPAILIMLQHHFILQRGYLQPYIFRESPNKAHRDQAVQEINLGTFCASNYNSRILADLIKLWFRELPLPILHQFRTDEMEKLMQMDNLVEHVHEKLGSLERTIIYWLADLLIQVASYQSENHMGIKQLAIIIAPNLIRIETENPIVAVTVSKAAVHVFQIILTSRFEQRYSKSTTILNE